ncbi:MAG: hypothetical protein IK068_06560 [Lachnospiraceae bacterium]|nr:hypothetical protein [Lachnospiraceae bacterium]
MAEQEIARIETEAEVNAYIQNLKYALNNGAKVQFVAHRKVDSGRADRYTNWFTADKLFPKEDAIKAIKRELLALTAGNYIKTVRDVRYPQKSEMREFGKTYKGEGDVYIKIRVNLLGEYGESTTFVMSFHFAERPFSSEMFPYRKG